MKLSTLPNKSLIYIISALMMFMMREFAKLQKSVGAHTEKTFRSFKRLWLAISVTCSTDTCVWLVIMYNPAKKDHVNRNRCNQCFWLISHFAIIVTIVIVLVLQGFFFFNLWTKLTLMFIAPVNFRTRFQVKLTAVYGTDWNLSD